MWPLTAATHQEISRDNFSKIALGENESRFKDDLAQAFPFTPKYGYTTQFAELIKEFIDSSNRRSAVWDVTEMAKALQTVNPADYKDFKESVYDIIHGPQHLTAQGAVDFQISLALNAFILDNKEKNLSREGYKDLFIKSSDFSQLQQRLSPGSFQGIVLSSRPKGALSTSRVTAVITALSKFSTAQDYRKFTSTLLALSHYNAYDYLMAMDALSNISAKHFTENFTETFRLYAKQYHTSRIPYGLMMAKDFDFNQDIMEQLIAYQKSLK